MPLPTHGSATAGPGRTHAACCCPFPAPEHATAPAADIEGYTALLTSPGIIHTLSTLYCQRCHHPPHGVQASRHRHSTVSGACRTVHLYCRHVHNCDAGTRHGQPGLCPTSPPCTIVACTPIRWASRGDGPLLFAVAPQPRPIRTDSMGTTCAARVSCVLCVPKPPATPLSRCWPTTSVDTWTQAPVRPSPSPAAAASGHTPPPSYHHLHIKPPPPVARLYCGCRVALPSASNARVHGPLHCARCTPSRYLACSGKA